MKILSFLFPVLISFSAFATTEHSQIDFGLVPYGGQRSHILTLTNNAETPLTNISAKIFGGLFYLKHNCSHTLNPKQSCQAEITFWAAREGYQFAKLTVTTSDKNYDVDLIGYGGQDPSAHLPPPPPLPPVPRP